MATKRPETGRQEGEGADEPPSALLRLLQWPVILAGAASTLLILVAFVLAIYAIVQRYVLDTPLKWRDELMGYVLVAIVMLGAAEALRKGDHIAIDLVTDRIRGPMKRWVSLFSPFAVLIFTGVFAYSAWQTVTFSHGFGSYSSGYLETPMWIPQSALLVGAVLLGLAALARLLEILFIKNGRS